MFNNLLTLLSIHYLVIRNITLIPLLLDVRKIKKYHGDVKVSGEKFSVGFVIRVVNKFGMYHKKDIQW